MSETKERTIVKRVSVGNFPNGKPAYCVLYSDRTIRIDNVRLSHPNLFSPYKGKDGKEGKYGVKAILPKSTHGPAKDICVGLINEILKDNKVDKLAKDRWFIRNGDDLTEKEYEGAFIISASEQNRPDLRDKDKRKMTDEDKDMFYGGCYGNILIRPWWQDSKDWGKRVNAGVSAVQFVADGEPFGTGRITSKVVDDTFDDIDDIEDGEDSGTGGGSASDDDDDL